MKPTLPVIRLLLVAVIVSTLFTPPVHSETRVNGNLSGEWTLDGHPYIITGNSTIVRGATLRIDPGVRVEFDNGSYLTVSGLLLAEGTKEERIVIQGARHTHWSGIRITDTADDRTIISYADISDGSRLGGEFDQNSFGGALNIQAANPTISNCNFDSNEASGMGGTIFIGSGARPVIAYCNITNCGANRGSIGIWQASAVIDNVVIRESEGDSPGIWIAASPQSTLITNSQFLNLSSDNYAGAGLTMEENGLATVRNSIFANNRGGAIYLDHGCRIDEFDHCTVANNAMGGERGAITTFWECHITVSNSIIWGHDRALWDEENSINITYSDVQNRNGVELGYGCIQQDPRFFDAQNNDFRLRPGSPCIDAGDAHSPNDPDGSRADMGYIAPYVIELIVNPLAIDFGAVTELNEVSADVSIRYAAIGENAPHADIQIRPNNGNNWIEIDPPRIDLAPNDSTSFELIVLCPENFDLGPAEGEVGIYIGAADDPSVVIPVTIQVVDGEGILRGVVTDAADGEPLSGVTVELREAFRTTVTDENGEYRFTSLPSWQYRISIDAESFLPYRSGEFEVGNRRDVVRDIALLYADCEATPNQLRIAMNPEESQQVDFVLRNRGTGECSFTAQANIPSLEGVGPYSERLMIAVEDITGDSRIQGVEFINDKFYVCGGNSGNGRGKIYVFDREGNLERSFDQWVDSNWGIRDLTWDGELIWGIDGTTIYGFNLDGDLVRTIQSPLGTAKCITYEADEQVFWVSAVTGSVFKIDTEGNVIMEIRNLGLRIYGLAWYPNDPDGSNLYVFVNETERPCVLRKLNPATRQLTDLHVWQGGLFTPGGCGVTNEWDPLSWVFTGILKSVGAGVPRDQIAVYQIEGRTDWVNVEQSEGVIPAGESLAVNVLLNTEGLPVDQSYQAEVIVEHNGRSDDFAVPIELQVTNGALDAEQTINLRRGVNIVSLNIQPDVVDIRQMTRPLVDANLLKIIKDQFGRFYRPGPLDFCNIPNWNAGEGYVVDSRGSCRITFTGRIIPASRPIDLRRGWQIVPYYPRQAISAPEAFTGIAEDLILAKDETGAFYAPEWGVSNLGNCCEGKGYRLLLRRESMLVWNTAGQAAVRRTLPSQPELYSIVPVSGSDMSLLVTGCQGLTGEIGVYAGDILVGSGVITEDFCAIAVRGRGEFSENDCVAGVGDELRLMFRDGRDSERVLQTKVLTGELKYSTDEFTVVELERLAVPLEFALANAYPNPFNAISTISYSLPTANKVSLKIFDLQGHLVETLVDEHQKAGIYRVAWNAHNATAGVYFCRIDAGNFQKSVRLLLVK